jgi:hypothetical protein
MPAANIYINGAGGVTGAALASLKPLYYSGKIYYLDSQTGDDNYTGLERNKPFATLAKAIGDMADYDTLVILAGSTETITTGVTDGAGLDGITIIGEGTGSQRPKFTRGDDIVLMTIVGTGWLFDNLYFPESTASQTGDSRFYLSGDGIFTFNNCYFECGANDTDNALDISGGSGNGNYTITNTSFVSVSTDVTAQPQRAVRFDSAVAFLTLDNVVFDGGVSGWSNPYAFRTSDACCLRGTNVDLLNDSDIYLHADTEGFLHIRNRTGSARVEWA